MPRFFATACASVLLPSEENGPGIETPKTFSAPSASTAIAATTAESMPPLRPTQHFAEAAFAHVIPRPGNQRGVRVGNLFAGLLVNFALAGDRIEQHQVFRERQSACAAIFPSAVNATLAPSKIKLSFPPNWFTYTTGQRCRSAIDRSMSTRSARLSIV